MIVTRKRKKKFPWKRILIPLAVVAMFAAALGVPQSRAVIAGHTQPVWRPFATPFEGLALEKQIRDQSRQIAELQSELSDAQSQISDRAKENSRLQTQLSNAQQQAVPAPVTPAAPAQRAVAPSPLPTPDLTRIAAEWSAMDSESAAKVVQKLPIEYVARVFTLMSPDAAGAILENLPAAYAAQLTQERPDLRLSQRK